jgi:PEP-CTERM motif
MAPNRQARMITLTAVLLCAHWGAQATTVDLTTAGASGSIGAGLYTQTSQQATGSGVIEPFVRVGAANQNVVQAYNTTVPNTFDQAGGAAFNHEITVGQVGFYPIGGSNVMRFLLDINQTSASPLLNLDEVQIFLSTTPNQSTTAFSGALLALADSALVYQMDAGGNSTVTLDYSLNAGSGSGDMTLDVLASAFDPAFAALGLTSDAQKNGAYVYLYSKFGSAPNVNNDGYEEWAYDPPGAASVAEPSTLALIALGLLGFAWVRGRRPSGQ